VTNLSVNPARSTGPALILAIFGQDTSAITQVWLFWVAPIIGAFLAGVVYPQIAEDK
jgi:aquaporin Z